MKFRVAVDNMEWMINLFTRNGEPKTSGEDGERGGRLTDVVKALDPDIMGTVEGPDTTVSGNKLASAEMDGCLPAKRFTLISVSQIIIVQ